MNSSTNKYYTLNAEKYFQRSSIALQIMSNLNFLRASFFSFSLSSVCAFHALSFEHFATHILRALDCAFYPTKHVPVMAYAGQRKTKPFQAMLSEPTFCLLQATGCGGRSLACQLVYVSTVHYSLFYSRTVLQVRYLTNVIG